MTKYVTVLFLFFYIVKSTSQTTTIHLDYTVSYEISSAKKGKDTVTISFDKKGSYFHTDNKFLAKDLAKKVFKRNKKLINNSKINLIFDVQKELLYINFKSGSNLMFFQMDVDNLIPKNFSTSDTIAPEKINLITKKTDKKVSLLNSDYNLYTMYPSNEKENPIYIGFDETKDFDMTNMLTFVFNGILKKENKKYEAIKANYGLVMFAKDEKGKVLLKAIEVNKKRKTIQFNHSFTID